MSKAVLISIRPKWCELIASGEKTIEVRKTAPKIETPFKCYIYCTKFHPGDPDSMINLKGKTSFFMPKGGAVIGEFVCDRIFQIQLTEEGYDYESEKETRLRYEEMSSYLNFRNGYGWHISDLVIYDDPKKLDEFKRHDPTYDFSIFGEVSRTYSINRPPQSWCYVEQED